MAAKRWMIVLHCAVVVAITASTVRSQDRLTENSSPVDFASQIQPLLAARCLDCHGPSERSGGLLLTERRMAVLPNDSGKVAVVPGDPDRSELMRRVTSSDAEQRMPPDEAPLADGEIDLLRRWITEGVDWPTPASEQHWAYVVPQRPALPSVTDPTWARNGIDAFVMAQWDQHQLHPSPPASAEKLLRRVYLDLIGLSPPPDVVSRWLAKPSEFAYQQIVDRLLASPAFGEKWARHWLDLARYSDSNGYQADQLRDMWAYRDWVIQAMSDDLPFDQFTIEQIAGDLLPDPSITQLVATGFHRATTCNVEAGVDPEANRVDQVVDRVNTTATVWLGTTLECAQCHNHKYDPFTQQDYYQLFSFFNNTPMEVRLAEGVRFDFWGPTLELPLSPLRQTRLARLQRELLEIETLLEQRCDELAEPFASWLHQSAETDGLALPEEIQPLLALAAEQRSSAQQAQLREYFCSQDESYCRLQQEATAARDQLQQYEPSTTLVMVEMDEPRPTHILLRGQFQQPGPPVTAGTPAALHAFPDTLSHNRLGLANWLVSPQNPLVGRVTVNRWWKEIFGQGLVKTLEDFGKQGEPPTHPQLLDYLATELADNGWSMKRVLRLIVTSSTYRQDSTLTPELAARDPENRLLSRGPRFRLPAESVRDQALAQSGLLSRCRGGQPVYPPQPSGLWKQTGRNEPIYSQQSDERRFRRGIYVVWRRAAPYPSFVNFDAPDRMSCVVARPQSNTPLQALTLLNDAAYVEMARALAARIMLEADEPTLTAEINLAFRICLARGPSVVEQDVLQRLFAEEYVRLQQCPEDVRALVAPPECLRLSHEPADPLRWATWCCLANLMLNLDETITKP